MPLLPEANATHRPLATAAAMDAMTITNPAKQRHAHETTPRGVGGRDVCCETAVENQSVGTNSHLSWAKKNQKEKTRSPALIRDRSTPDSFGARPPLPPPAKAILVR